MLPDAGHQELLLSRCFPAIASSFFWAVLEKLHLVQVQLLGRSLLDQNFAQFLIQELYDWFQWFVGLVELVVPLSFHFSPNRQRERAWKAENFVGLLIYKPAATMSRKRKLVWVACHTSQSKSNVIIYFLLSWSSFSDYSSGNTLAIFVIKRPNFTYWMYDGRNWLGRYLHGITWSTIFLIRAPANQTPHCRSNHPTHFRTAFITDRNEQSMCIITVDIFITRNNLVALASMMT